MPTTITKTIKPSGGDYTSLSAWEAGMQKNLVTADEISVAECYSMQDTASVSVDGWTTDSTRYIYIYTPGSERHDGKYNTSKYRLETSGNNVLEIPEDYVRVKGLQIVLTGADSSNTRRAVYSQTGTTSDRRIEECVIKDLGSGTATRTGIEALYGTIYLYNNIVYDFKDYGINSYWWSSATWYVYNNTVYGCGLGINRSGGDTVYLKNNLCNSNTTDYSGTFTNATTNLSEDATSPNTALRNKAVTFVDEAGDDFHLASSDTNAKDAGTDLSADSDSPYDISMDIDGVTRSGTWDIGADEYVAAGGLSIPIAQYYYQHNIGSGV